jgi:hypothetical protein
MKSKNTVQIPTLNKFLILLISVLFSQSIFNLNSLSYSIPPYPTDIKCGDINADGDMDLIINHRNYGLPMVPCKISLLENNGDGYFIYADSLNMGASYLVAVCQMDNFLGDDIVVLDATQDSFSLKCIFNNNTEEIYSYFLTDQMDMEPEYHAVSGDFNGDGLLDIAMTGFKLNTGYPTHHWCYLYNLGNRQFSSPSFVVSTSPSAGYHGIACADFNEDSLDDIVCSYSAIDIYYGLPNGFQLVPLSVANNSYFVVTADMDHDGDKDIVTNAWEGGNSNHFRFWENIPGSDFILHEQMLFGSWDDLYAADLNNDGYDDLITLFAFPVFAIFFNLQDWTLGKVLHSFPDYDQQTNHCCFGDFDGNGTQDIAIVLETMHSGNLIILFNDGNGNFREEPYPVSNNDSVCAPMNRISCYPNPARSNINFSVEKPSNQSEQYSIYNIKGQRVYQFEITNKMFSWDLKDDTGHRIPSGLYMLARNSNSRGKATKFIVLSN